jgi:hypothetical protein
VRLHLLQLMAVRQDVGEGPDSVSGCKVKE